MTKKITRQPRQDPTGSIAHAAREVFPVDQALDTELSEAICASNAAARPSPARRLQRRLELSSSTTAAVHPCTPDVPHTREQQLERPEIARKRLVTIRTFAAMIEVSPSTVYTLLRRGMPYVQVLASKRIDPEVALTWIREHGAAPR